MILGSAPQRGTGGNRWVRARSEAVGEQGGTCPLSSGRDGGPGDAGMDFPLFAGKVLAGTFVQQSISAQGGVM